MMDSTLFLMGTELNTIPAEREKKQMGTSNQHTRPFSLSPVSCVFFSPDDFGRRERWNH